MAKAKVTFEPVPKDVLDHAAIVPLMTAVKTAADARKAAIAAMPEEATFNAALLAAETALRSVLSGPAGKVAQFAYRFGWNNPGIAWVDAPSASAPARATATKVNADALAALTGGTSRRQRTRKAK